MRMLLDTSMFDADLKDIYGAKLLALAASAGNEVIVQDHALEELVDFDPTPFDEAVRQALAEREAASAAP